MIIKTNNKKYSYKLDNRKNILIYDSYKSVSIGIGISSFALTKDDKYLFLISKSNKIIYTYLINPLNGLIILSYKNHIYKNLEKLKVSKSDNYIMAYNNKFDYLIYSINKTNGSILLINENFFKKTFDEEFKNDYT